MKKLSLILFPEIETDMSPGMRTFEKELIDNLSRYEIRITRYTAHRKQKIRHKKYLSILSLIFYRHIIYPFKARSYFSPTSINFVTNSGHAQILNFASDKCIKIIHCHDLVAFIPQRILHYKLDHGGIIRHIWALIAQKRAIRKADFLIAISENTKNDLIKYLHISEEKIQVVYNGVNHNIFRVRNKYYTRERVGLIKDNKYILNVSSSEQRKNFPSVLKAFSIIFESQYNFNLIHVGKLDKKSKDMIKKLNLDRQFINFENISEEKLALLYNASDLFVFPSFYEGFGLPVLEAMASGCPVITSNKSSLPEVVDNAGILVDPENIDELGNMMYKVLTNNKLQKDMIQRGVEQAKKFSWQKCAREIYSICNDFYHKETLL